MTLRRLGFALLVMAFRPAYASIIHYQRLTLEELAQQAPLIVEAAPVASSKGMPESVEFNVTRIVHVSMGWEAPPLGRLRIEQGGSAALRHIAELYRKDGTMKSPIIPAYEGPHGVTDLKKGKSYLLFLNRPHGAESAELFAMNSVTTLDAEASVKATLAQQR